MKNYKIGLLGFGFMGKTHAFSLSSLPYYYNNLPFTAEYASVCTSKEKSAINASALFKLGRPTTHEDDIINDENIDIIDICTPNKYHFESAKKAILSGKHVLCEKPLTITYEQAWELDLLARDAYNKNRQVCGIVFNNRHLSAIKTAKALIDEGKLGRIISFDFKYLHNSCIDPDRSVGWKQDKDICGGGTLFDLGSHIVDLCRYLCGDFVEIYSREQIAFPTHKKSDGTLWETNADEAAYMTATLSCGAIGTLTVGKIHVGENDGLTFSVYGTQGTIRFDLMECDWLYFYDANARHGEYGGECGFTKIECVGRYPAPAGAFPSPKAPSGWLRGHIASMHAFLDAVDNGREACPSFKDGAEVQKILEAAHLSHIQGKAIKIN